MSFLSLEPQESDTVFMLVSCREKLGDSFLTDLDFGTLTFSNFYWNIRKGQIIFRRIMPEYDNEEEEKKVKRPQMHRIQ